MSSKFINKIKHFAFENLQIFVEEKSYLLRGQVPLVPLILPVPEVVVVFPDSKGPHLVILTTKSQKIEISTEVMMSVHLLHMLH